VSPAQRAAKAAPAKRAARPAAKSAGRAASKSAARPAARKAPAARRRTAAGKGICLVVGYDGGESARAAVGWAASVLPSEGRIVLVYSSRNLHGPASPLTSAAERRRLGQAVIDELLLESPKELLDRQVAAEVSDRDPVRALTMAARRHGASGIVVGIRRHSRLRNAIGTVTGELLKASPIPVTAVPHSG